ncbi:MULTISPECIES: molybdate ABC transporter substrate-binding protein [Clostridium]|uniref:molybdate ABC transporter substrate-binding protein n=1 Tax=Clostridium TaxID=1485 RepID=UPI00082611E6|nr:MULTISPECIES: molybdate ABC transporter substrate-binding protein [Clostridium]PJI08103.1 molybdate ABC transporter substrate-binding protein [Clostridium sp. CT7]
MNNSHNKDKNFLCYVLSIFMAVFLLVGCTKVDESSKSLVEKKSNKSQKIIVLAAASLTESFNDIGKNLKKDKNIEASFNFAGSQQLVSLIEQDVNADVFVSADNKNMNKVIDEKKVSKSVIFTKNELVIGKYKKSSASVNSLKDLAKPGIKIIVGDKSVPCGAYFYKALQKALQDKTIDKAEHDKILANIKSNELNVKDIVSKVNLGEADVGIVYKTDINKKNKDKIQIIEDREFSKLKVEYPIAVINVSKNKKAAQEFINYVTSTKGKSILKSYGFSVE